MVKLRGGLVGRNTRPRVIQVNPVLGKPMKKQKKKQGFRKLHYVGNVAMELQEEEVTKELVQQHQERTQEDGFQQSQAEIEEEDVQQSQAEREEEEVQQP
ncbi:unnamed protein product [Microthlaspi erraticum]|uniref:Uncharacterized protein n=1 Tax=Microthlaspi erraticum TaxID=1685480 RepID=A0A6D2HTF5_9BRAS|nr:unnamed protein product [Microthlaspi erraticum]